MTSIPSVCFTLCSLAVIVSSEMCLDISDCSITACTHGSTMTCEDGECTCTASSSRIIVSSEMCLDMSDCSITACTHGSTMTCEDGECTCTASSSRTCLTRGDCTSGGRGCRAHGHGHGEWHCVDGMCRCRRVDRD